MLLDMLEILYMLEKTFSSKFYISSCHPFSISNSELTATSQRPASPANWSNSNVAYDLHAPIPRGPLGGFTGVQDFTYFNRRYKWVCIVFIFCPSCFMIINRASLKINPHFRASSDRKILSRPFQIGPNWLTVANNQF